MAAPALLGGCGETDGAPPGQEVAQVRLTHSQYQDEIQTILRSEDSRLASSLFFDTVANGYDTEECSAKVRRFHDRLGSIIRQVEDLEPPSDAHDAQRDFLAEAKESVRLVGVAADDVGKSRLTCGQPLNKRIYGMPSTRRAEDALATLEERGYVIFGD
jgi:hypothetical protein